MTLRNFLSNHINAMVTIKTKRCTEPCAVRAVFAYNNCTIEMLLRHVKRVEMTRTGYTIYID